MIAEIIIKKLTSHLNKEEEIFFKKWLSENDENFLTFQRLKKLQHNDIPLPNIDDLNSQDAWQLISNTQERYKSKTNKPFYVVYLNMPLFSSV